MLKESSHCRGFLAAAGVCQCGSQSTANEAAPLTEQHRLPQAANRCRECLQAERCSGSAPQRLEAGAGRMEAVKWEHFNPNGLAETAAVMRAGGRARRVWLPALLDLNPATRGKQGSINVKKQTTLGFSKFVLTALELTEVQVKVTAACSVVLCRHGAHPCMLVGSFTWGMGTGEGWHLPFLANGLGVGLGSTSFMGWSCPELLHKLPSHAAPPWALLEDGLQKPLGSFAAREKYSFFSSFLTLSLLSDLIILLD